MKDISQRINLSIKNAGLSYGELSKITDIPKSALQRYATGVTSNIPLNRIEAIAKATNVKASYLLGWNREPMPMDASVLQHWPDFKPGERYLSDCVRVDNAYAEEEALELLETSPAHKGTEEATYEQILSSLTSLLKDLGWIGENGDISDEDRRFLLSVAAMLNTYFENQG